MSDPSNDRFARLFIESRDALRRYVQRLVRSREAADEIVQEAFLRTYQQGPTVQTPRAFLFSTARNLASNARRHERIAGATPLENLSEAGACPESHSPEEDVIAEERNRLLQAAVDGLPPQCRAAFTLRVFHDHSYKEIAARLGISTKTVEKHIALGLRETHSELKRRYKDAIGP